MMRNFRDFLGSIFGNDEDEGPDLFEYASQKSESGTVPASNSKSSRNKKFRIAAGALAAMYPVLFAAGYYTHKFQSVCGDLEAALGMVPDIGLMEGDDTVPKIPPGSGPFLGSYSAEVSGHKAILYIYALKSGGIGGSIRFTEWGKRELEYLKAVRVEENRLSFIRSCRAQECVRIGSPSNIYQVYSGTMDSSGDVIKGNYTGGQSASSWTATRIR